MSEVERQTISYLTQRLKRVGLRPQTRLGQNFLIDLNLIDLLVRTAEIGPRDVILEIGTGMGGLTAKLAERAASVVTVEVDRYLLQLAREELEPFQNIRFLHQDALRNKNLLSETIVESVQEELAAAPERRFKLAANLPYGIATPVLSNLLTTPIVPDSMTVTIQKDVAERIVARPSTKDYSALSIWIQSLCDVEIIRVLPASVFWPRPNVESAIIQIRPQADKRKRFADLEFFHRFIRSLFLHRRKRLRSALFCVFRERMEKSHIDSVLGRLAFGSEQRAEELDIEHLIELAETFRGSQPSDSHTRPAG